MQEIPAPPSDLPIPETEEVALEEFARDPHQHVEHAQETGKAVVLTDAEGYAEAVLLDVESYRKLLHALEEARVEAGVFRGLYSMARGEGIPAEESLRRIRERAAQRKSA